MEKEIVSNSLAEYVSSAEKLKNLLLTIYSESKNENRLTSKYLERLRPHTYNQKDLYLLGKEFVKNMGKGIFLSA